MERNEFDAFYGKIMRPLATAFTEKYRNLIFKFMRSHLIGGFFLYTGENKMYNILIKYNDSKSLWQLYGTSSSTTSNEETFVPFETDDLEKLKAEIKILDEKYGHENIKVVKTIEYTVDITISDSNKQE